MEMALSIYEKAIEKWGSPLQINMMIEEMAELTVALSKYLRYLDQGYCLDEGIYLPIIDELADVQLMINQMKLIFGEDAVSKRMVYKINRLRERLKV
jgi:hypothetical protein